MMFVTIVSCGRWCLCVFDPIYSGGSEFKITAAAAASDGTSMLLVVCSVFFSLCASFVCLSSLVCVRPLCVLSSLVCVRSSRPSRAEEAWRNAVGRTGAKLEMFRIQNYGFV